MSEVDWIELMAHIDERELAKILLRFIELEAAAVVAKAAVDEFLKADVITGPPRK